MPKNCWLCFRLICMLISENAEVIASGALKPVVLFIKTVITK